MAVRIDRRKMPQVIGVLTLFIGIVVYAVLPVIHRSADYYFVQHSYGYHPWWGFWFRVSDPLIANLMAASFAALSVGSFLLGYLRPTQEPVPSDERPPVLTSEQVLKILDERVEGLKHAREGLEKETPGSDEYLRLLADSEQIIADTASELSDSKEHKIERLFRDHQNRLRREIVALGKRSNLNLVVGVLITAAATILLVYLVTRDHGKFDGIKDVLAFYIPRVTTVALIETFAYFFVGLYRANLQEIKYYQNEQLLQR